MATQAPTAPAHAAIEAEDDNYNDGDSAIASDLASSTTSIGSSILNYRKENGRTYHAYKEGKYVLPNDNDENDRLDLQHHLCYLTLENKLHICPIPEGKPLHRVLDLGTGTGIWAIDFADENPESEVIGIDLSPIQPSFLPPNCKFEVDDVEEPWTFSQKFDFIHSRFLTGSIANWPDLISKIHENLAPGGWVQLVDMLITAQCDDGTLPKDSKVAKWADLIMEGCGKSGRPANTAPTYKERLTAAGFEDVVEVVYKWPMNRWPKDPHMKEIGMWELENLSTGLSGLSVAIFTRLLGWNLDEMEVFLASVRNEMKDTKIHSYFPIYVVYGRKPGKA